RWAQRRRGRCVRMPAGLLLLPGRRDLNAPAGIGQHPRLDVPHWPRGDRHAPGSVHMLATVAAAPGSRTGPELRVAAEAAVRREI
ncbi:hypothetical protein, partial [Micromonospora musae]|uniref:hypothetical protein n=1 Tax=Micromonospora musae TaxID=1894970 RepID=UPI00341798FC